MNYKHKESDNVVELNRNKPKDKLGITGLYSSSEMKEKVQDTQNLLRNSQDPSKDFKTYGGGSFQEKSLETRLGSPKRLNLKGGIVGAIIVLAGITTVLNFSSCSDNSNSSYNLEKSSRMPVDKMPTKSYFDLTQIYK